MIADKALTTPTDTQQLMELKEFVEKAEEKDLVELGDRMALAWHRSATKNRFLCKYYVWC
jgi:dynein heavy chain